MSYLIKKIFKHWRYPIISLLTLSIVVGTPQVAKTFSLSFIETILQGVQVIQLSNMSDEKEVELGQKINKQLVSNNDVTLYQNRQINNYVNKIGQRIVPNTTRPDIPYTFQVVEDSSINAFATVGGFVYLHTGLIAAADNEAELASVIAHEIAHIEAKHGIEQMRERAIAQGLLSASGLDESDAVQIGVELAYRRPNSREDEYEADKLGLNSLTQSGYAPIGMIQFMEKLQQQGGSPPTFLSTHPNAGDRIEALRQQMDHPRQGDGLNSQAYQRRTQALR